MNELFFRYFLESAMVIPAAVIAMIPVRDHLKYPKREIFGAMLLLLLGYMVIQPLAILRFGSPAEMLVLPAMVVFYIAYHLSVDLSLGKKLFCFGSAVMMTEFCNLYVNVLRAPVEQFEPDAPFQISSGLICLLAEVLVGLAFIQILWKKLPELLLEDRINNVWPWLAAIQIGVAALIAWAIPSDVSTVLSGQVRPMALAMLLLIPLVELVLFYMFSYITTQLEKSARLQQENELLQMEEKRYNEMRNYVDSTRALRHDFRQHVLVLRELAQQGENEKLTEYLSQLTDATATYKKYSLNPSVDAIAAFYDSKAKEQGTALQWDLKLPKELPVGEADFCGILGNLLENALKATAKEEPENRKIRVISRMLSDKMIGLSVDNTFSGKVRFDKNGLPVTRRVGHGIGLNSVAATVHHYQGTMDISCKNGVFSVNILLYAP